MAVDPEIRFEGGTYRRRGGSWVDDRNVWVPIALAARLNAKAHSEPDLWAACVAKDASERPLAEVPSSRRVPVRRGHPTSLMCSFDESRVLFISADLAARWRKRRAVYGFFDQTTIALPDAQQLRVQIALWSARTVEEPDVHLGPVVDGGISWIAHGAVLLVRVGLFDEQGLFDPALGWRETRNGKPHVYREVWPASIQGTDEVLPESDEYRFRLWLIAQPPARKPAPVYYEWSRRFFPGGLPSLGKGHS